MPNDTGSYRRILQFEDNPGDAELLRAKLVQAGVHHEVTWVRTWDGFFRALEQQEFDLVLLDYNIQGIAATQALDALREKHPDVPVIVVSGSLQEEDAVKCLQLGATDYLFKDRLERLGSAVTRALEESDAGRVRTAGARELAEHVALLGIAGRIAALGGWSIRTADRRVSWSSQVREILEVPAGFHPTIEGVLEFVVPAQRDQLRALMRACMSEGVGFDRDIQARTGKGRTICVRFLGEAVRDETGRIIRVQGACQDVTALKLAEETNRALTERLTLVLESMTDAFITTDASWRLTYLNRAAERLVHRTRADLLGKNLWAEFPNAAGTTFEREYNRALRENVVVVFQEFYAELNIWVEVRAIPSGGGLGIFVRDITDRVAAEAKLRENASLLDKANDAIWVTGSDGTVRYWNESAERVYGYTGPEALGKPIEQLVAADGEAFRAARLQVAKSGEWRGEMRHLTKSRQEITVEVGWTLVRSVDGASESILAINADVTERKKLEQQFLRAQRMESVGTLASGIAHDLNNLLAPIVMGVGLLRRYGGPEESMRVVDNIDRSARRGSELVKQVLSFARGVDGARISVRVHEMIAEIELIVRNTFPRNITLSVEHGEDAWAIIGDPTQLNQLLMNLCVNARDAMPSGGRLTITARNEMVDSHFAALSGSLVPGPYVLLEVADTGSGMSREVVDRIFEPFFTTKEVGRGTGLGLSTVLGIVRSHHGAIDVQSEPGRGTVFRVRLPAQPVASEDEPPPAATALPMGNGELILVADDEESVLAITRQTLEACGYRVITAEDGAHAVAQFAAQAGEVRAVVTDMMMPVMDGPALVAALHRINPRVPIIAVSGLGENRAARLSGVSEFLMKPYSAESLLVALKKIIA